MRSDLPGLAIDASDAPHTIDRTGPDAPAADDVSVDSSRDGARETHDRTGLLLDAGDVPQAEGADDGGDPPDGLGYQIAITPSTPQNFTAVFGQSSPAASFTITRAKGGPDGFLGIGIVGPDSREFIDSYGCMNLFPGTVCPVEVTFAPTVFSTTSKTAELIVTAADGRPPVLAVPLVGVVIAGGDCVITPLNGGVMSTTVGTIGTPTLFTLTNTGDSPSRPLEVAISSTEFVVVSDTCTGVFVTPMGGTCNVGIALRPTSAGDKSATLTISTSSGGLAAMQVGGHGYLVTEPDPCTSAIRAFACMSDATVTPEQTWEESQDMTIHGVVTDAILGATADGCSRRLDWNADAQTHSLTVRDEAGHVWYPQYYLGSSRLPWRVGDAVDIRYQTTVPADGRPRRSMVLSSGGRVIAYVAEAITIDELPAPPVALHLAGVSSCPSHNCGGARFDVFAGPAGVSIPYGREATVDGYRIVNADFADIAAGSCDSDTGRISVGMLYDPGPVDGAVD